MPVKQACQVCLSSKPVKYASQVGGGGASDSKLLARLLHITQTSYIFISNVDVPAMLDAGTSTLLYFMIDFRNLF